jgi:CubicO group peptidase (beta-lactamase class C family)
MRIIFAGFALLAATPALAQAPDNAAVDAIFAPMAGRDKPGCAVGVARDGATVLTRGYGSADLEHDVPITPATIFEAGSVSKQFTAAAILLLVKDGKLQLTDDVRKYVPELPDYGTVITIDHLLNHSSGLRDWGSVMQVAGWPRTTRAYTQDDTLAIIARQRALNYRPGAEYSYTNSGYSLLTEIVKRVSGSSLADFTKERMFEPLGMRSTSWRDDFRRIVPGRAIAYDRRGDGFVQEMPFEDTYGHGALLTNVEDLLTWNEALTSGRLGKRVAQLLAEQAILTGGRRTEYARGLVVQERRGQPEISHGGATAGYRAWLGRFPQSRLSVAMLCNNGAANPGLAYRLTDLFMGPEPAPAPGAAPAAVGPPPNPAYAGTFVNELDGIPIRLDVADGKLKTGGGGILEPITADRFRAGRGELRFDGLDRMSVRAADGEVANFRRAPPYAPTAAQLNAFLGRFASEEAGAAYHVLRKGDGLVLRLEERPQVEIELKPAYADAFTGASGIVRFRRNGAGRVTGLGIGVPRVRDLVFRRTGAMPQPGSRSR